LALFSSQVDLQLWCGQVISELSLIRPDPVHRGIFRKSVYSERKKPFKAIFVEYSAPVLETQGASDQNLESDSNGVS